MEREKMFIIDYGILGAFELLVYTAFKVFSGRKKTGKEKAPVHTSEQEETQQASQKSQKLDITTDTKSEFSENTEIASELELNQDIKTTEECSSDEDHTDQLALVPKIEFNYCYDLENTDSILRRRKSKLFGHLSPCSSGTGTPRRTSFHLDVDLEKEIVARLDKSLAYRRKYNGSAQRSPCDSGLGSSRRTSVDLDDLDFDFENAAARSSSLDSVFEPNDLDKAFCVIQSVDKALKFTVENEVIIPWENAEHFEINVKDCSTNIIESQAFQTLDLSANKVTVNIAPSQVHSLDFHFVDIAFTNSGVPLEKEEFSCYEITYITQDTPVIYKENNFQVTESLKSNKNEPDYLSELLSESDVSSDFCDNPEDLNEFEEDTDIFQNSGGSVDIQSSPCAEHLVDLDVDYRSELDSWDELKKEILNLNLFEPVAFQCELESTVPSLDLSQLENAGITGEPVQKEGIFNQPDSTATIQLDASADLNQLESAPPSPLESVDSNGCQNDTKLDTAVEQQESLLLDQSSKVNAEEESCATAAAETIPKPTKQTSEVGTITDIHYKENVDEVDLISLVEEKIPKYKLRADTITDFTGYDNSDWIQTPALSEDFDLDLSPTLIRETLKYFVLCSERVSQMTRAYHDIEAVTRLLEEKERDLELAARIGQGLLEKNNDLEAKLELLEEHFKEANEKIAQLRHEVCQKEALLQLYDNDYEADIPSPLTDGKFSLDKGVQSLEALQKKVQVLEQENSQLKNEAADLQIDTSFLEEKEENLVSDCVRHLDEQSRQLQQLQEDLALKSDVCVRQQEEITSLMGKLITYETKLKKAVAENEDVQKHLAASQDSQKELTIELRELEEKHNECMVLLRETQEELKSVRKKAKPSVIHQHYGTSSFFMPEGSLAMELEKSDVNVPEGYTVKDRRKHVKGVFKTAKAVRRSHNIHGSQSSVSLSESLQSDMSDSIHSHTSDDESLQSVVGSSMGNRTSDLDSVMSDSFSQTEDSGMFGSPSVCTLGKPGVPGSNDLETALRRLALRRANDVNRNIVEDEEQVDNGNSKKDGDQTPTPCNTPDSSMSTESSFRLSGQYSLAAMPGPGGYRIPEKLQIVKPLEGSSTLHKWQRLAQPRLEGIFEQRPGIQNRGEKTSDLAEEIYSLSDCEEDGTCDVINDGANDVIKSPLATTNPTAHACQCSSCDAPDNNSEKQLKICAHKIQSSINNQAQFEVDFDGNSTDSGLGESFEGDKVLWTNFKCCLPNSMATRNGNGVCLCGCVVVKGDCLSNRNCGCKKAARKIYAKFTKRDDYTGFNIHHGRNPPTEDSKN